MNAKAIKASHLPMLDDDGFKLLVLAELDAIFEHPLFRDTTRMKRFLRYIVTESLEGRADRLKGYSIGLEVFDRKDDFDPQADTIVRVQAGQLRRRLRLYYSEDGANAPVRIVVPVGSYAPKFELQQTPLLSAKDDIETSSSPSHKDNVSLISPPIGPGILVTNLSLIGDIAQDEQFALGLTSEIASHLTHFRYLRVISRTASVDIEASAENQDIKVLGQTYNVQYILSGSLQRSGDMMRLSIHLIDTITGEFVFAETQDRQYTVKNILALQDEISTDIAVKIGAPYGVVNRTRYANIEEPPDISAYEAVLRYYAFMLRPNAQIAENIITELSRAVEKSPRYSSAWAALSLTKSFLASQTFMPVDRDAIFLEALENGWRATALDGHNALSYHAVMSAFFHTNNLERYRSAAARALKLNSYDDSLLAFYGITLAFQAEFELAKELSQHAIHLNPDCPIWYRLPATLELFFSGHYEAAIHALEPYLRGASMLENLLYVACIGLCEAPTEEMKAFVTTLPGRDLITPQIAADMMDVWNLDPTLRIKFLEGARNAGLNI